MADDFDPISNSQISDAERARVYDEVVNSPAGTIFDRQTVEASGIAILETAPIYPDTDGGYNQSIVSDMLRKNQGLLDHSNISRSEIPAALASALDRVMQMIHACLEYQRASVESFVPGFPLSDGVELNGFALPPEGYKIIVTHDGKRHFIQTPARIGFMIGRAIAGTDGYEHAVVAIITNGYRYTDPTGQEVYFKPTIDIASLSPNGLPLENSALKAAELGNIVRTGSWYGYTNATFSSRDRFYPDKSANGKLLYYQSSYVASIQGEGEELDGSDMFYQSISRLF